MLYIKYFTEVNVVSFHFHRQKTIRSFIVILLHDINNTIYQSQSYFTNSYLKKRKKKKKKGKKSNRHIIKISFLRFKRSDSKVI